MVPEAAIDLRAYLQKADQLHKDHGNRSRILRTEKKKPYVRKSGAPETNTY